MILHSSRVLLNMKFVTYFIRFWPKNDKSYNPMEMYNTKMTK